MRIAKRQLAGSGEALPAGAVGETVISAIDTNWGAITSGAITYSVNSITLTPGIWVITAFVRFAPGSATPTAGRPIVMGVSDNGGNSFILDNLSAGVVTIPQSTWAAGYDISLSSGPVVRSITTTTTIKAVCQVFYSGTVVGFKGQVQAVRIA